MDMQNNVILTTSFCESVPTSVFNLDNRKYLRLLVDVTVMLSFFNWCKTNRRLTVTLVITNSCNCNDYGLSLDVVLKAILSCSLLNFLLTVLVLC
jgi:hypothetical protein